MSRVTVNESASAPDVGERLPDARSARSHPRDWLALIILLLATAHLAVRAAAPVTDPDTWWHLRLGDEFRGSWSLSEPGQLSSFATRPWFATQWTLELLASYTEDAFGLRGVSWLVGAAVVVLAVTIYVSCRQRAGVLAASVATALGLLGTTMSIAPRPQVASFIFAAIVTSAWLRTIDDGRGRWWLVALTWIWACTHGMWFIGVAIGAAVVLGMFLDGTVDRRGAARLAAVPALSLVAAGLTPVGPMLLTAPFATSQMAQFVSEWQPPDFSDPAPAAVALMIAVVAARWARNGSMPWAEMLLLASAAGWTLIYARTVPVGAVLVAPLFASAVQSWLPSPRRASVRGERAVLALAAALIIGGLALVVPHNPEEPLAQVDDVNSRLEQLPEGTVVFNEYSLGGWLEWRHRNVDPVVDGMTDAYEVEYMADYASARSLEPGWHDFVESTGAEYALFEKQAAISVVLLERDDWILIAEDGDVMLFQLARG
jgi:hypothetical protein